MAQSNGGGATGGGATGNGANGNGSATAQKNGPAAAPGSDLQVRILNQYIKDMSFENPSVTKPVLTQGEQPNIQVEVNVNAQRLGDAVYESAITLRSQCTAKAGAVYEIEVVYGGIFEVKNLPEPQLEPFLLVQCPALLFPFLRRIVADTTREGGFPPLLLDPIDFASLYMRRQQVPAAGKGPAIA